MKNGLNGTDLKRLALFAMLLDHIGAVLIPALISAVPAGSVPSLPYGTEPAVFLSALAVGLRFVGRISMPIYCFLLVEGFSLTTDLRRYLLSIGIFAVLSEVPFDLACFGTPHHFGLENVFFTLFLGLLFMAGDAGIFRRIKKPTAQIVLRVLNFTFFSVAAQAIGCDYGIIGIMLIAAFYYFRTDPRNRAILAGFICILESVSYLGAAALSLVPISVYNGERGPVRHKYFYYAFYPAHLLLLYALVRICLSSG